MNARHGRAAEARLSGFRDRLRALGAAATDSVALREEALPLLKRALGFEIGVISTTDPATLLWTSCVLGGIGRDPAREAFLFRNEYVEDDLNRVSDLARTASGAATLGAHR